MKNGVVFTIIQYNNLVIMQNQYHIRNQREKLHQSRYFLAKKFFHEKSTCGPPQPFFLKNFAVVPHRSIFRGKIFLLKNIWIDAVFYADYEYNIFFALKLTYNDENC